jgi:hypothetical protein
LRGQGDFIPIGDGEFSAGRVGCPTFPNFSVCLYSPCLASEYASLLCCSPLPGWMVGGKGKKWSWILLPPKSELFFEEKKIRTFFIYIDAGRAKLISLNVNKLNPEVVVFSEFYLYFLCFLFHPYFAMRVPLFRPFLYCTVSPSL